MGDNKDGKKNVFLLGLTSFFNDVSSEMIMPILPFFLASLGASPVLIGLVGGLRDSLDRLLKVFFGYLSDKTQERKSFVYGGYVTSAAFKILLAFSPTALIASAFASLERIGKGMRDAPRDAMIDKFMPRKTGTGFGLHQMLDTSGAVLGSIIVLAMIAYLSVNYGTIILIAGVIGLLSLIPLFLVKNIEIKKKFGQYNFISSLSRIPKKLLVFNIIASLFALANFSYMFFILRAQVEKGIVTTLALYVVFNIAYALFAYPLGKRSDSLGKREILIGGYLLFALVSLAFVYFTGIYALVILFVFYGISNAAVKAVERAYVADMSPSEIKATSLGMFQTMTGIAAIPSGLIAGYLWEYISPETTFFFGAGVAFIAAVLLVLHRKR